MSTIDPSKVKPGDTVTLERDTALARDVVERIDSYPQGGFSIVLRETNPAYLTVTGWTITDHQPAPAPEWEPGTPGTATVGGANGEVELRGMWTQRGSKAPAVFTDLEGDIWGASLVRSFVPDDAETLRRSLEVAREGYLQAAADWRARVKRMDAEVERLDAEVERLATLAEGQAVKLQGAETARDVLREEMQAMRADLDASRTQVSDLTGRNSDLEALVQEQKKGIQARDTWIEDQTADL